LKPKPENSVDLPLGTVFALIPPRHRTSSAPPAGVPGSVAVEIDNLIDQLAGGRVVVPVALLVMDMPTEYVASTGYQDYTTVVTLPLAEVVAAIPTERLTALLAAEASNPLIERLPDPFGHPDAEAPAATAVAPTVPDVAPVAAAVPSPAAAAPGGATAPAVAAARAEPRAAGTPDLSVEPGDRAQGIDINFATAEQLQTLPGVTPSIARQILLHRAANGHFASVFDLLRVAHLGRVTFRKMTGMPYNARHVHRIHKLARLLAIPLEQVHRLPVVAERLAARPGFAGCVISDTAGLVLAESHAGDSAANLGALAPRLFKRVEESIREMESGDVATLSLTVADRMFTLVRRSGVFVCAMHRRRRVTLGDLRLTERVAEELAWLLSHRACVTPSAPAPAQNAPDNRR
jgi:predicted regulator of Ras-like GTPase activity (Roadblock/LC7/MglB family)